MSGAGGPGHPPRKRFGQHFLHDPAVVERIVDAIAPREGDRLVEIGPGEGVLTRPLAERVRELHAVEIDRDLAAALPARVGAGDCLRVHRADALEFDFTALGTGLRVAGNLPYNISTPLLFHLFEQRAGFVDLHFMLQREVVERMVAPPGTREYGRLSVMVALYAEARRLFTIGAGAFRPPPRVESAFVRLRVRGSPAVPVRDLVRFSDLVARAFSQRRKMLRSALSDRLSADTIAALGIDPTRRPETLSLAEFAALANVAREPPARG